MMRFHGNVYHAQILDQIAQSALGIKIKENAFFADNLVHNFHVSILILT